MGAAGKADAAQRAGVRAVEEFETGLVAEVFGVAEKAEAGQMQAGIGLMAEKELEMVEKEK